MTTTPTPPQAALLAWAVRNGGSFGPLGVDLRTYDALLRHGWVVERWVDRSRWGFGPGVMADITDAGREALARSSKGV